MWLRDFLPKKTPNARILLFGYNSNAALATSAAGVQDQAEVLFSRLVRERKSAPNRPLIFICHSLGGLIVKRVGSPNSALQKRRWADDSRRLCPYQNSTIDSCLCTKQLMDWSSSRLLIEEAGMLVRVTAPPQSQGPFWATRQTTSSKL
jgi:hypothetical protein